MPATKTAKKTGIEGRIEKLRALAEHPNTPVHEAALARVALERILERLAAAATSGAEFIDTIWYGAKYAATSKLNVAEISKLIRDEIKLIRKAAKATPLGKQAADLKLIDPIGDAPADLKISVRSERFSGGCSIDITLINIPEAWKIPAERHGHPTWTQSPELTAPVRELKGLMNAYNYDGSDTQADYWNVRFYDGITDEHGRSLSAR
jgi:hypothetical protein